MATAEEKDRISSKERREKLAERIKTIGIWNINQNQLAVEFGVSRQMINKDVQILIKSISVEDAQEIGVGLMSGLKIAYKMAQKILLGQVIENNPQVALKACQTIAMLSNSMSSLMQNAQIVEIKNPEIEHAKEMDFLWGRLQQISRNGNSIEDLKKLIEKLEDFRENEKKLAIKAMINHIEKGEKIEWDELSQEVNLNRDVDPNDNYLRLSDNRMIIMTAHSGNTNKEELVDRGDKKTETEVEENEIYL